MQPTPAIGGVGILKDVNTRMTNAITQAGQHILVIGKTTGHLGSSLYLRELCNREDGTPPPVNLHAEHDHGNFVRGLIQTKRITACHDISDGGLLVALAEMCLPKNIGAQIHFPDHIPSHAFAFGEDQGRYILVCDAAMSQSIMDDASEKKIPALLLGTTGGGSLEISGVSTIGLTTIHDAHIRWFAEYMK